MPVRKFILPTVLPPVEAVLGRLGYNPKKNIHDDSASFSINLVNELIAESRKLIHPVGNTLDYRILKKTDKGITTENGLEFLSAKLAKILDKSDTVTLLICTIGNELKIKSEEELNAGNAANGVIFDAIASEAVEAFAEYINDVLIREKRIAGKNATMRFSPGYGDLSTHIHQTLLPLLEADSIGVTFHPENFILKPEKSISAIIGWKRL